MNTTQFLTVRDALEISPMFRLARKIDPIIESENAAKLDHSYRLVMVREIFNEAWGIVFSSMIHGEHGLSKFQLLPPTIQTSPLCISVLLENEYLFQLAASGKVSYTGIVRLAHYKGIWAY